MPDVSDFDSIGPLYPTKRTRKPEAHRKPRQQEQRDGRRKRREPGQDDKGAPHIDEYA